MIYLGIRRYHQVCFVFLFLLFFFSISLLNTIEDAPKSRIKFFRFFCRFYFELNWLSGNKLNDLIFQNCMRGTGWKESRDFFNPDCSIIWTNFSFSKSWFIGNPEVPRNIFVFFLFFSISLLNTIEDASKFIIKLFRSFLQLFFN